MDASFQYFDSKRHTRAVLGVCTCIFRCSRLCERLIRGCLTGKKKVGQTKAPTFRNRNNRFGPTPVPQRVDREPVYKQQSYHAVYTQLWRDTAAIFGPSMTPLAYISGRTRLTPSAAGSETRAPLVEHREPDWNRRRVGCQTQLLLSFGW